MVDQNLEKKLKERNKFSFFHSLYLQRRKFKLAGIDAINHVEFSIFILVTNRRCAVGRMKVAKLIDVSIFVFFCFRFISLFLSATTEMPIPFVLMTSFRLAVVSRHQHQSEKTICHLLYLFFFSVASVSFYIYYSEGHAPLFYRKTQVSFPLSFFTLNKSNWVAPD